MFKVRLLLFAEDAFHYKDVLLPVPPTGDITIFQSAEQPRKSYTLAPNRGLSVCVGKDFSVACVAGFPDVAASDIIADGWRPLPGGCKPFVPPFEGPIQVDAETLRRAEPCER